MGRFPKSNPKRGRKVCSCCGRVYYHQSTFKTCVKCRARYKANLVKRAQDGTL